MPDREISLQANALGPDSPQSLAISERIPFEIRMADGTQYRVRERYQVAVGRTSVVVLDDRHLAHILPLLTMAGLSYLKPSGK